MFLNSLAIFAMLCCVFYIWLLYEADRDMHPLVRAMGGDAEIGWRARAAVIVFIVSLLWLIFG